MPQLPLEAIILSQGGFEGRGFRHQAAGEDCKFVPQGAAAYLGYWVLTGGADAGSVQAVEGDLGDVIETVLEGLRSLIVAFRDVDTPFYAVPDTGNVPRFNDYEHLSRLKEWAALDDGGGEEVA